MTRLVSAILVVGLMVVPGHAAAGVSARTELGAGFGELPLAFEPNRGQADSRADYLARGSGYTLFLTGSEAILILRPRQSQAAEAPRQLRLRVLGATPEQAVAAKELPGVSNYLRGSDPGGWLTGVPHFAEVRYPAVYPGIDLVYRGREGLEYDFIVHPGGDPRTIQMAFDGAAHPRIGPSGDLLLELEGVEIVHQAPFVYQEHDGQRQRVEARYAVDETGHVRFKIASYDRSRPLIIDPPVKLDYATYLGGGGTDFGFDIALDEAGSAYVVGETTSTDFPLAVPFQPVKGSGIDGFVTKLAPDGRSLVYSTYLGGVGIDRVFSVVVNGAGNAYVSGTTNSPDFPLANPFQPVLGGGARDGFVSKLDAAGSALAYSTYLGGGGTDEARAIALDGAGRAFVTGLTASVDFPTAAPLQPVQGGNGDAFVTVFSAAGTALDYSTYLGGSLQDEGNGVAVDGFGSAYVVGETFSLDFPTSNPWQPTPAGSGDAFVSRLDPLGATLDYSSYLGGSGLDTGLDIAVDILQAHVTGETESLDFPTVAAIQPAFGGGLGDAFVTKFSAVGNRVDYSTYLGGVARDAGNGIAIDPLGNTYVAGETLSGDFPSAGGGPLRNPKGAFDAFVTKLDPGGVSLVYSLFVGGSSNDGADAVAVDAAGSAFLTGFTLSANFPARGRVAQPRIGGGADAFAARLQSGN